MSPPQDALPPDLQRRIRAERKFSLGEAIGREGGSFLKDSQMPRPLRALTTINGLIDRYLNDTDGALQLCLKQWVKTDGRIGQYLDEPRVALQLIVKDIVEQPQVLYEFARQVAVEWGQLNGERPSFQKLGEDAHPEAVYSHDSIRAILVLLLSQLSAGPIP
ncbi:MAG: hypothetical protein AAF282_24140 [Cyanobacteria bacterium P01_A01_bin.15]